MLSGEKLGGGLRSHERDNADGIHLAFHRPVTRVHGSRVPFRGTDTTIFGVETATFGIEAAIVNQSAPRGLDFCR